MGHGAGDKRTSNNEQIRAQLRDRSADQAEVDPKRLTETAYAGRQELNRRGVIPAPNVGDLIDIPLERVEAIIVDTRTNETLTKGQRVVLRTMAAQGQILPVKVLSLSAMQADTGLVMSRRSQLWVSCELNGLPARLRVRADRLGIETQPCPPRLGPNHKIDRNGPSWANTQDD